MKNKKKINILKVEKINDRGRDEVINENKQFNSNNMKVLEEILYNLVTEDQKKGAYLSKTTGNSRDEEEKVMQLNDSKLSIEEYITVAVNHNEQKLEPTNDLPIHNNYKIKQYLAITIERMDEEHMIDKFIWSKIRTDLENIVTNNQTDEIDKVVNILKKELELKCLAVKAFIENLIHIQIELLLMELKIDETKINDSTKELYELEISQEYEALPSSFSNDNENSLNNKDFQNLQETSMLLGLVII